MTIRYKILIDNPILIDVIKKDQELDIYFNEIIQFVYDRLLVLKDEIDYEEGLVEEDIPNIIIDIETDNLIAFVGYSKPLRDKMKSCFSQEDIKFLFNKIEKIISSLNN